MVPAAIASATSPLGRAVLIPIRCSSIRISSHDQASLRAGLVERSSQTSEPGEATPSMAPGLAQWAMTSVPSSRITSARKRLYRRINVARTSGRG
jgi:hypothetical protein